MISFVLSWMLAAGAIMVANQVFEKVNLRGDFSDALWVSGLYAVLSWLFGWLFFVVLGLASLGLGFVFSVVTHLVAASLVLKMTSALSSRFTIRGFPAALGTAILLALASELAKRVPGI